MTPETRPTPSQRDGVEQHRLLMENVKDYAIFLLDNQGRVVTWNTGAERILGYQEGEIVGQPFARIFTPEDVEQDQPELELRVAGFAPASLVAEKDGQVVGHILFSDLPIVAPGRTVAALALAPMAVLPEN